MITQNLIEVNNPKWQDRSACANSDPAIFFDERFQRAKALCTSCPVVEQCLQWTLKIEAEQHLIPTGFYGGKTAQQRKKMRLCSVKGCTKRRLHKKNSTYSFCSVECEQIYRKILQKQKKERERRRMGYAAATQDQDYYMRGTVRHA